MKYSLEQIDSMLAGITPGEWFTLYIDNSVPSMGITGESFLDVACAGAQVCRFPYPDLSKNNASFIAASPTIVRELVEEVKRLKELEKRSGGDFALCVRCQPYFIPARQAYHQCSEHKKQLEEKLSEPMTEGKAREIACLPLGYLCEKGNEELLHKAYEARGYLKRCEQEKDLLDAADRMANKISDQCDSDFKLGLRFRFLIVEYRALRSQLRGESEVKG